MHIYIYIFSLADFFLNFAVNLMGRFSTLIRSLRPGLSRGTSLGQGEQPRAITKLTVVLHPPITAHPLATVRPLPVIGSSPTATNQGQVVSGGPVRPSPDLIHSPPYAGKGKQLAEESHQKKRKQAADEDNTKSTTKERGLMANIKRAVPLEKFISINPDVSSQGRVSNIKDHFGCLLLRLFLSLLWLNESISKDD